MKTVAIVFGLMAISLSVGFFFASSNVSALEFPAYSAEVFETAQSDGAAIIVDVHASWCSTCRAQRRALEALIEDPRFANIVFLEIDYDTQKEFMRALGASQRSTLIAFQGANEIARLVGDTRRGSIEVLLEAIID
ncbi:MAG: thioredoxin family protein [Alphaproteobacteria bacterium]